MPSPSPRSRSLWSVRAKSLVLALVLAVWTTAGRAELRVGTGVGQLTPPVGTPSAGYGDRMGQGMTSVHDPLVATALVVDNGAKRVAFVGVDHLGFDHAMVRDVVAGVPDQGSGEELEIYVGASHTHAGGGAYLAIPVVGERLAGKFDPAARRLYIDGAVEALRGALASLQPARVGIGYGHAPGLNAYRGDWPPGVPTQDDVAVLKAVSVDGRPLAVLFNYAAHATVLPGRRNMAFSADFVGYARQHLERNLGEGTVAVYFNGAQGDVSPRPPEVGDGDMFARAKAMGEALALRVKEVWDTTAVKDDLAVETLHHSYKVDVQPTSAGLRLPMNVRTSELNLIVFDRVHAFVTVPGELSTIYDADIKRFGGWLGYLHTSILGLTNDAHGYIITPESWRHQTYESTVSFGGEMYGELVKSKVYALLHALEPEGAYQEERAKPSSLLPGETP